MCKILQFPLSPEAKNRLLANGELEKERLKTEAAIQRPGYILLAWGREMFYHEAIRAWYLSADGSRWVYHTEYDTDSMKELGTFARHSSRAVYEFLVDENRGRLFLEFHLCAPPYILLDSKDSRKEFLKGRIGDDYREFLAAGNS